MARDTAFFTRVLGVMGNLKPRPATRDAQEWERHANKKRSNPTYDSGALLATLDNADSVRKTTRDAPSTGSPQLCNLLPIFYPVTRFVV